MESRRDVNASSVIENPRSKTLLDVFVQQKKRPPLHEQLVPMPEVTRRDFSRYLKELRDTRLSAGVSNEELDDSVFDPKHPMFTKSSSPFGLDGATSEEEALSKIRNAFDIIPKYFFDPNFNLREPDVFAGILSDMSQLDYVNERLTSDLDVVEHHLLTIVKSRSNKIFSALTQIQDLRDSVANANVSASALKDGLSRQKIHECIQPLQTIAMNRRRSRKQEILGLLYLTRKISAVPDEISRLYTSDKLIDALDLIAKTRITAHQRLKGVQVIDEIILRLDNFERVISNDLVDRYVKHAVSIITVGAISITVKKIDSVDGSVHSDTVMVEDVAGWQFELEPIFAGLARTKHVVIALEKAQKSLSTELGSVLRAELSSILDEVAPLPNPLSTAPTDESLIQRCRVLPGSTFNVVLRTYTQAASDILSRTASLNDLIDHSLVRQHVQQSSGPLEWVQRAGALAAGQAVLAIDITQRKILSLLTVRREQAASLRVLELEQLWHYGRNFHASVAAIAAREVSRGAQPIPPLEQSRIGEELAVHAYSKLQYIHGRNLVSMKTILDSESWKQADVPSEVQRLADSICNSSTSLSFSKQSISSTANISDPSVSTSRSTLQIYRREYPVVGSAFMLITKLAEYSSLSTAVPVVAGEAVKVTVQLLRLFNDRARRLILGTEAVQLRVLTTITSKHLALTAQSLCAIMALLPALRASLLMLLSPSQHSLLSELARVTADYIAHENDIRSKFVGLIRDVLVNTMVQMRQRPWGDPEASMTLPSEPMLRLNTQFNTLFRILRGVFSKEQVGDVFSRVAVMLNSHLPGQVGALVSFFVMEAQKYARNKVLQMMDEAEGAGSTQNVSGGASDIQDGGIHRFSKSVAWTRLAVDLRALVNQLRSVLADIAPQLAFSSSEAPENLEESDSADASLLSEEEAEERQIRGAVAAGEAAIASLAAWVLRQTELECAASLDLPPLDSPESLLDTTEIADASVLESHEQLEDDGTERSKTTVSDEDSAEDPARTRIHSAHLDVTQDGSTDLSVSDVVYQEHQTGTEEMVLEDSAAATDAAVFMTAQEDDGKVETTENMSVDELFAEVNDMEGSVSNEADNAANPAAPAEMLSDLSIQD